MSIWKLTRTRHVASLVFCLLLVGPTVLQAQFEPEGAHCTLYFPQLADGGPVGNRWQTSFMFFNPNPRTTASVRLYLYGNDGQPLALNLGSAADSTVSFSIPPSGTRLFRSAAVSDASVTGWAVAFANVPIQGTVLFRLISNGVPQGQVSALGTLPTLTYRSPANKLLGVAIANIYSGQSVQVDLSVSDSEGNSLGSKRYSLGPLGHASFNLFQVFPELPQSFSGSIRVSSPSGATYFVAWTIHVDSDLGTFASLPPGNLSWPISHWERIWDVFNKLWAATQTTIGPQGFGTAAPELQIVSEYQSQRINAWGGADRIIITYALSELISDSPSELAWIIAHEMGHVYQRRTGRLEFVPTNREFDADVWGFLLGLFAGYDPYGAAGALAKMSMITGTAGLNEQFEEDTAADAHKSFNTRLDLLFNTMVLACGVAPEACDEYKTRIHPSFPFTAPLSARPKPVSR